LTSKQRVVLALFIESGSINQIAGKTKLSREEVLYQLMNIGRALAYYEIMDCSIFPQPLGNKKDYLKGWNDFRKRLIKEVRNGKIKKINEETE
jgi:hypothetical protein